MYENKEIKTFCKQIKDSCIKNSKILYTSPADCPQNTIILEKLLSCKEFECPDGYYFDTKENNLYIFEHFEFDCSPNNKDGSKLRKNESIVMKNEEEQIEAGNHEMVSFIVQGYDKKNSSYGIGDFGDKYKDNYVKNFTKIFKKHLSQIEKYKENCLKIIKCNLKKIIVSFVFEDAITYGTFYFKNNKINKAVNPLLTLQFIKLLKNSEVDFFIYNSKSMPTQLAVLNKECINDELLNNSIDIEHEEFYIVPVYPKFTYATTTIIDKKLFEKLKL